MDDASSTDTISTTNDLPDNADVQEVTQTDSVGETNESSNEESFFDPNSLPEELVPAYKQMQGAFTKKTQEIAQTKKEAEEWKAKVEQYTKYEQFLPVLDEMFTKQNTQRVSPEMVQLEQQLKAQGYSDEAIEMMKVGAQFTLNQLTRRDEMSQQQQEQTRINKAVDEASTVDARLTDQSLTYQTDDGESVTFGAIVANLVKADPNWQRDPVTATKRAIKQVDAMIGRSKTEGKEELSNSAKSKGARFPDVRTSPRNATSNSAPMTIREAAAQAKAELGIQ